MSLWKPIALTLAVFALACPGLCLQEPPAAQVPSPGAAPQGPHDQDPAEIVLATINDRKLTLADAMQAFSSSHTGHSALVRGEKAVRELLGRLVERELFLAEAAALGVPDEEIIGSSVDAYRRSLVVSEFWKRELTDKVKVSQEDVETFYGKTDIALKVTLIQTKERADCERLWKSVGDGADMAALAIKESVHASRSFGGKLPYVRRGDLDPQLEKLAFALEKPGSLTNVVAVADGFAFARIDERTVNEDRLPREIAFPQIRKILHDRTEDALRAELESRLEKSGAFAFEEAQLLPAKVLGSDDEEAIVARSTGEKLTLGQLRDALDLEALRRAGDETTKGAARHVALDWAQRQVIWKEAQASGLVTDPEVAKQTESYRKELILGVLAERYIWPQKDPTEEELRDYYDTHRDSVFTRPPERRLAYIIQEKKEEAEELLKRIKSGEDFEKLAREKSKDKSSAMHGGRIGWIKKGDLIAEVEDRAFALPTGAIDGPIDTPQGWFIVRVLDRREPELVPFEAARPAALKRLVKERQQAAYEKWTKDLRERADFKYDEDGIRAAVEWLDRQPKPTPKPEDPSAPHPRAPMPEREVLKKGDKP